MPVASTQRDALGRIGQLVAPAAGGERLVGRRHREVREAVGAADLLLREVVGGDEVAAGALAVGDAALARDPAPQQHVGADTQRGDGTDARDDDATAGHDARATTSSIASPTVLRFFMSSPLSSTP